MDIISHTLTGVAAGTVLATASNGSWQKKGFIILVGGLGGALPDVDAISLWSKFDGTIGAFLGLEHTGEEIYFGKFWYSHHAAFHSLLAPFMFLLLTAGINLGVRKKLNVTNFLTYVSAHKFSLLAFLCGFILHILEDMPTPASVWGGVHFFFPFPGYIGGFGNIWWWNNYDLVLIISVVVVLNLLINMIPKGYHRLKTMSSICVFVIGLVFFMIQINTRPMDFAYSGHTVDYSTFEAHSKDIQQEILGDKLFEIMTAIDRNIPLNF
ncbi:MAG: metal-dependent hydrolase [Bacteroidota bacterium]